MKEISVQEGRGEVHDDQERERRRRVVEGNTAQTRLPRETKRSQGRRGENTMTTREKATGGTLKEVQHSPGNHEKKKCSGR